jgi:hypothetical protein
MISVAAPAFLKEGNMSSNSDNDKGNNKMSSKLGRKGDPRMHRAVAARLANPDLTLFEALRQGGFDYPTNDEASVVDSEKVTLGQRKNQLSRRLRLARKQQHSGDSFHSGDSPEFANPSMTSEAQKELEKLMEHNHNNAFKKNNLKRDDTEMGDMGLNDEDLDAETGVSDMASQPEDKRARIAKFHPDYAPLFVSPSTGVRNSFPNGNNSPAKPNNAQPTYQQQNSQQGQQQSLQTMQNPLLNSGGGIPSLTGMPSQANANVSSFQSGSMFGQSMGMFSPQHPQQVRPSSVAVASLSATAQAVGMTLEQLAMSLSSSTSNLAKVLTEDSDGDSLAKKQELALSLYQSEARALYSKCMLLAGMDPRICHESSPQHSNFALLAWQTEGKRLQNGMYHTMDDNAPTETTTAKRTSITDSNKNGSSSTTQEKSQHSQHSHDHEHQGHSHSHDHCDGRHVHRLEGKCGHKAIIHQPKDGPAHIDFVVGSNVECYHGIESTKSLWPSKYKCADFEEACGQKCGTFTQISRNFTEDSGRPRLMEPKSISLSEINLLDPEWNELNGPIDETLMGLFKLGERGDE